MYKSSFLPLFVLSVLVLLLPCTVLAQGQAPGTLSQGAYTALLDGQQSNVPAPAKQAETATERAVRRFRIGVTGGVGLDPEIIMMGVHGAFGPLFKGGFDFRPGLELGIGEVTTMFGINLDVTYGFPVAAEQKWIPYIGGGPNFGLSHQGFEEEATDGETDGTTQGRFDFGDTDFESGLNMIAGVRNRSSMFIELRATAYGVANIKMLVGYNF